MGEIATSNRQITMYYDAGSEFGKKTRAYAETEGFEVLAIDVVKEPLTGTQLLELADRLGIHISELVDQQNPAYAYKFNPHDLSSEDWVKMLRKNPEIMRGPIVIHGDKIALIETISDIKNF